METISFLTVGLSAGVSVCTGYVSVLFNYSRQRQRQRRIYGLALLAEVKALQKMSRQYYGKFAVGRMNLQDSRLPKLRFGTTETAVFNNVAGNVGLFSAKTAILVIEYYSTARNVAAQAQTLVELQDRGGITEADLRDSLADHLRFLRAARRHGALAVRSLRRETPNDLHHMAKRCRRRMRGRAHRMGLYFAAAFSKTSLLNARFRS